jgi:hypothetical protein
MLQKSNGPQQLLQATATVLQAPFDSPVFFLAILPEIGVRSIG